MKIRAKIWVETDQGNLLLGEGRLKIFKTVDRTGSLSAAARDLGMSYRALWGKVKTTEERLGIKLVTGVSGGSKHGGSKLTDEARAFIKRFEEFDKKARQSVNELAAELLGDSVEDLTR